MVRRREAILGILLAELARVLAEATDGAHVLALRRDRVTRFEAVTDPDATTRLGAGRGPARVILAA